MSSRPNWHEIFRYEPDGTLWYRAQITGRGNRRHMNKPAGNLTRKGYILCSVKNATFCAHRIIWEMHHGPVEPGMVLDHINNKPYDNRIENLQQLTNSDNLKKRKINKNNTIGYKGVTFDKVAQKFKAQIGLNRKTINLGLFKTPEEAHAAYKNAALFYYGPELARFE